MLGKRARGSPKGLIELQGLGLHGPQENELWGTWETQLGICLQLRS